MFRACGSLLALGLLMGSATAQTTPAPQEAPQPMPPGAVASSPEVHSALPADAWTSSKQLTLADRWSFGAEYLLWWVKRAPSQAPYITTTSALGEGLPAENTGSLGDPNTLPLIDSHDMDYGAFSGLRAHASVSSFLGRIELRGFLLERRSGGGDVSGDFPTPGFEDGGFPFIAQPFFDVEGNIENAYFISVPTFSTGSVAVSSQIRLFGGEANLAKELKRTDCSSLEGYLGYRFLGLNENLNFQQRIISLADEEDEVAVFYLGQDVFRDGFLDISDQFRTSNRFHGGQVGGIFRRAIGDLAEVSFRGSIAFGVNQQLVEIRGFTQLTPDATDPDQNVRGVPGGIFAQPTNIGRYFRNEFSFVPEGELAFHVRVTHSCTASLGYSFLFWTNVVRPGDQLDRRLDRRGVPSDPTFEENPDPAVTLPAFPFRSADIWMQGFTFGLEWRY